MEKEIFENTEGLSFKFEKILKSISTISGFLIFLLALGACSRDADFNLKKGAENLRSFNRPEMKPSVLINNGLEYTKDSVVNLSFNPDGEAREMLISLNPDCSTGSWEPFEDEKSFELTELNKNTTVYVKYRYKIYESDCVHDEITHDSNPPRIELGRKFETPWIKDKNLDVSFLAEDSGSGVKLVHCDLSGSGDFKPCDETVSFRSMVENRDYHIAIYVEDHAGNFMTKNLNWRSDQTPPKVVLNRTPAAVTNDKKPRFSFTASDSGSGVASYWCRLNGQREFKECGNDVTFKRLGNGEHQLEIKAFDRVGWPSEVLSYSWTQDHNAPTIKFTRTPDPTIKEKNAVFEFAGNNIQDVTSYKCRFNGGDYKPCSSPQNLDKLPDGRHSFSVIGSDLAGNPSSPITYRWQVDTLPPTLAFSRKPKPITSSKRATFSFIEEDSGSGVKKIQCRLDNGPYKDCNSFSIFTGLSSGRHRLVAKAEDHAGNPSHPPIEYQWLVDRSEPVVTLTSVPDSRSDNNQARFAFDVTDQISGIDKIECRLDGESFKPCESPVDYSDLSEGTHSFSVRATDKAGNPSLVQSHEWLVDTKGPEIVFLEKPDSTVYVGSRARIHFSVNDRGVGVKNYQCSLNGNPQNCSPDTLYKVSATHYGNNTFQITAFDELDNETTKTLNWTNKYELVSWQQEFKVKKDRPVDVLFVVDNSGSMDYERGLLAQKIEGFLHNLESLNWQVAVISTEIYHEIKNKNGDVEREIRDKYYQDGRLLPFDAEGETYILDSTMDVNMAQALFEDRIATIPIDDKTGAEQGIYATVRAIERALDGQGENTPNARFFRKEAHLAVVVLSDEDENSKGENIQYTPSQFLLFAKNSLGQEKNITWHSIVIMSGDEDCKKSDTNSTHAFYGTRYEELSILTGHGKPGGAVIGSICDEDYTDLLRDIGQSVKDKHNTIDLKCQPSTGEGNDERGEVLITHKAVENTDYESYVEDYVIQDQKVIFDELLDPGDYRLEFSCRK